jgi:integrase
MNVKITKVTDKKATDTYHRALDSDEMKMFMDELKSDYYFEFIAFQYATGCRIGEVSALNWSDIDTKKNCIHITKTLTYTADGKAYIGDTPKTNAGIRDIPMNETIKAILESQKAKSSITPIGAVRIFNTVNGGLVYNYAINRAIKKCLKRLEAKGTPLEHLTSHFLRDTFATQFAKDTKDLQTLKTILGHNSLAMTSDLYAHVLDVTKQEAMEAINIDIVI